MIALVLVALAQAPQQLTLEQALQSARQHQPTLRQARAQAEGATARAREAFAPLLPQVSAGLGYSRSTSNFVARPGSVPTSLSGSSAVTLDSYDYFTGNLAVSATLWDFGAGWNRWRSAEASALSQQAQTRAAEVSADLAVRTAFFDAAAQAELVAVAQATLDNDEAHLKQVEAFVKAGTRPAIDLAQSRSLRANARLALVKAHNAAAVARARLSQAMGLAAPAAFEVADEPPRAVEGEDGTAEVLFAEAMKARPELESFDAQLDAQERSLASVRGTFWPTLGAQVGATLGARQLPAVVPNLSAQVSLSWPLYSGGATAAQVRQAEAALAQLHAARDAAVAQVRLDVEQARLGVRASREAVEVAGEAVEAAREQLRQAEARYKAGAGSAIELSDAQVTFTDAAAQRVQAVYALATARAQLLAALGRR